MQRAKPLLALLGLLAVLGPYRLIAAQAASKSSTTKEEPFASPDVDFESEDTFIDQVDAVGSKQYVRRAILSSIITETSRFAFNRPYINHLMGFSSVYQRTNFAKYVSGLQGLSLGYITQGGHGFEVGFELAAVSDLFAGYRYIYRPEKFSLWPFIGTGIGTQVTAISFSDPPPEAKAYDGMKQMFFGTFGVLVPLVDVGIKAEARLNFYGTDRLVLSTGVGVVIFL